MTDTQMLLRKIAALRQQLEEVQSLSADTAGGKSADTASRMERLERQVSAGAQQTLLLDSALRQLTPAPPVSTVMLPRQLTARTRRILERGRALLAQLRLLADVFDVTLPNKSDSAPAEIDPLARRYHETVAMAEATLRMIQAFPDAPTAQLRLCEGLDGMLEVIADRIAGLEAAVAQRRCEEEQLETLADCFRRLYAGEAVARQDLFALAAGLLAEADQAEPLRFVHASPERPARFAAGHCLTSARVMARIVRDNNELRGEPVDAVLAALLHDVGMLGVDPAILAQPGPLDMTQRRAIEAHARAGAEILTRLLPDGAGFADAALGHHERLDGTGYPDGLRDQQVAPLTRLIAVCDVYAAMCAPRPYRSAFDTRTALTDTLLLAEHGGLDRYQAERLLQLSFYPVGSVVELADGAVGLVVATHMGRRDLSTPARPVLALLTDTDGLPLPSPHHVDLAQCEGRSIVRLLPHAERQERLGTKYPELVQ